MEQVMTAATGMMGRAQRERAESFRDHNRTMFDQQRRARRGPTPEIFFTKHLDNSRLVKADDPERHKEVRSFTIAMSVLLLLTMTYVWQHFSSIELGYSIEAQKIEVEHLREANRQLRLTEAQLSDPGPYRSNCKAAGAGYAAAGAGDSTGWVVWPGRWCGRGGPGACQLAAIR